jgi:hypothetical protein
MNLWLLLQVLLADREVLQDQVVAVELANERLAAENGALAAEAARLKLEHEKVTAGTCLCGCCHEFILFQANIGWLC